MTKEDYQSKFGGEFKKFIESPAGQALVMTLSKMSPNYEYPKEEHLYADNRGSKRGYDLCLNNIFSLTVVSKPIPQPEANYGVPDKP